VLQTRQSAYVKDNYGYRQSRRLFGNGLLTSDGDFWRRQRRLAQPAFSHQRIAGHAATMVRHAAAVATELASHGAHGPFDVLRQVHAITIRIIGEALFGADIASDLQTIEPALSTLAQEVTDHIYGRPVLPWFVPSPENVRRRRARRTIDHVVERLIGDRRGDPSGHDDLLSRYMSAHDEGEETGMSDAQLRDEVLTLFMAGEETVANAVTWALHLLGQHPEVERRVADEVRDVLEGRLPTAADLERLAVTHRVLLEAMRLFPPAWVIGRRAAVDDTVAGHRIPAGAEVLVAVERIHRHPEFWPAPERFDPDRFLPAPSATRHRWAYIPFIAGAHQCIGMRFALLEGTLLLAVLLQRLRFRPDPRWRVVPEAGLTLRPRGGLRMYAEPR
jgi:cytochrome P450